MSELIERLREWALGKSTLHHRLAHENENLRTEHLASSSAYLSLADELAALPEPPVIEEIRK